MTKHRFPWISRVFLLGGLAIPSIAFGVVTPSAPTLSNPHAVSLDINVNPNGNPETTLFAIQCTACSDPNSDWIGSYVDEYGFPSYWEVWQTDADWGVKTIRDLKLGRTYTFAVKAWDGSGDPTDLGPTASMTTHLITHYVKIDATGLHDGSSWQDAFTDLQDAIAVTFPGDEIWVAQGTYYPSARSNPSDRASAH